MLHPNCEHCLVQCDPRKAESRTLIENGSGPAVGEFLHYALAQQRGMTADEVRDFIATRQQWADEEIAFLKRARLPLTVVGCDLDARTRITRKHLCCAVNRERHDPPPTPFIDVYA